MRGSLGKTLQVGRVGPGGEYAVVHVGAKLRTKRRGQYGVGVSAGRIVLRSGQRRVLLARARQASGQHRDVVRARMVLAAADGASNAAIGRVLGVCDDTVRKWPRRFAAAVVAEVKALACELPAKSEVPLARWSCPDLATEAIERGVVESVSASTVRRWLAADALKPWQHRSWICPRDPHFAAKAAQVLDRYQRGLGRRAVG
jgi:hypothetical protein